MDDPALYHEELLEHAPALEQLSYYLTREEQSAHDLVQETMITALERPPRHRENLGGWLHTVARNLALRGHRTRRRRERRETEAARPESTKPPHPERDEILERVASAVEELNEPYRTVIRMRFFDEMPPRMIAAVLNRPIKTVKSQLHRGLGRLRIVLEKEFGEDEEIWAASLLGLILPDRSESSPTASAPPGNKPATPFWNSMSLTLSAIAAALAFVLIPLAMRQAPEPVAALALDHVGARMEDSGQDLAPTAASAKVVMGTPLAEVAPAESSTILQVEARDDLGVPIPGGLIEVFTARGGFEPIGSTNAAGRVSFPVDEDHYVDPRDFHDKRPLPTSIREPSLGVRLAPGETHSSSLVYWVNRGTHATVVIEAGRDPHVASGVAVDEMGFPIAGAQVLVHKFDRPRYRTKEGHLATLSPNVALTDAQGRFELSGLPDSLYWLIASKDGFAPSYSRQAVFDAESTHVEFVMRSAGSLQGRVSGKEGLPVSGATIQLRRDTVIEERSVRTDAQGEYEFRDLPALETIELLAVHGGSFDSSSVRLKRGEVRYLDFVLADPPIALALEVTDAAGGLAGLRAFECVALENIGSRNGKVRQKKSHHFLTTDAQGVAVFPPQSTLPDEVLLYELNEVGIRLPTPSARVELATLRSSRSALRVKVRLQDSSRLCDLRLRIVDDRGRTMPDASVQARSLDGQRGMRCRRLPGDDGIWIRHAEPGRYALFAQNPAIGQAFLKEVLLEPGEVVHAGDLALPARATLVVDSTWWPSLPELPAEKTSTGALPIQFELHQISEWSGGNASFSLFREPEPRVSYEVLPGQYALRRVQGRTILDETPVEVERVRPDPVAKQE